MGFDGRFRFLSLDFLMRFGIVDDFKFSLVGPLFATPLYVLGFLFKQPHWWVSKFSSTFFLLSLYFMYRMLRGRMDPHMLRRFLLLLLAASLFPKHIKEFYGEPFTQLLAAMGVIALVYGRERLGFFALVFAGINTAGTVVASALVVMARAFQTKRIRYLLIPVFILCGFFLENFIRRGHPFLSGYEGEAPDPTMYTVLPYTPGPGFSYPIFFGILSVLFSFGKGLLFFTPALFLPWGRRRALVSQEIRQVYVLWLAYLLGLILLYGRWFNWYGGGYWGPRFFLEASLPACLSLSLYLSQAEKKLWENLLCIAVLALSVWVAWCGLAIDESLAVGETVHDLEAVYWYVPEFSVIWSPFVRSVHLNINEWVFAAYFASVFVCLAWPSCTGLWASLKAYNFGRQSQ